MESTGKALRIHVSSSTTVILQKFGTFELKLRGDIEVKVWQPIFFSLYSVWYENFLFRVKENNEHIGYLVNKVV